MLVINHQVNQGFILGHDLHRGPARSVFSRRSSCANLRGSKAGRWFALFSEPYLDSFVYSPSMNRLSDRPPVALRAIALFEAAKGGLACAAAAGLLSLRHTDLHAATDAFLLRHGIDPERHYTRLAIESVAAATHSHAGQIAGLAFAYGFIRLAEAYGLWKARHWAEWFAVISAGLYLPLELQHFARRPSWLNASVILFNIALMLYLGKLLFDQRARRKNGN